jgi:LacI family transcriptional regulator
MSVLLADSDMHVEKELVYMSLFDEERVAGMLLAPLPSTADDIATPGRWSRPVVVLNSAVGTDQCCVTVDNEQGGYLAARHLIETGRRKIVFAGGPFSLAPVQDRQDGVVRAVKETNGAVELSCIRTDELQAREGRIVGEQLAALPDHERPDGIVAAADLLAMGIIQSMSATTGVRFGVDVGLIGYDNNRAAWESSVPISTMAQPGEDMGRAATRLLLEEIQSPATHQHQHLVLSPQLIVRESSADTRVPE